jgi:hypothetical protein
MKLNVIPMEEGWDALPYTTCAHVLRKFLSDPKFSKTFPRKHLFLSYDTPKPYSSFCFHFGFKCQKLFLVFGNTRF